MEVIEDWVNDYCKYATLFIPKGQKLAVHIILTEDIPTQDDFDSFYKEIDKDPEFGLVGRAKDLYHIVIGKDGKPINRADYH